MLVLLKRTSVVRSFFFKSEIPAKQNRCDLNDQTYPSYFYVAIYVPNSPVCNIICTIFLSSIIPSYVHLEHKSCMVKKLVSSLAYLSHFFIFFYCQNCLVFTLFPKTDETRAFCKIDWSTKTLDVGFHIKE